MSNSQYKSKRTRSQTIENSFSEELYNSGSYFSDYDLIVTDNSTYHQYRFSDGEEFTGKPRIKRIIEFKYDATPYVKAQMKNQEPPNAQTLAFASIVSEVNRFRITDKLELWFFIQSEGEYPYYLFEFDCENNKFEWVRSVTSRVEFLELLKS